MICKNCKQENPDNIKFCPHCGTKVEQGEEVNGDKVDTLLKDNMLNKSKTILKRMNKKVWLAIGFVMIVFLVMIMGVNNKTIDLNKYVTIEVTGYDTVAKAIVTFDENSFKQDYSDKLSYNEDNVFGVLYTPTNYVLECISWELNQETNLTNGDTITLTWDCLDDLVYNNFGYKLKYKDISYKVKGLEKVDTFNPFDSITVEFSGVSPYGTVAIHNNMEAEVASNLYVEADVKSGLRMKDIITVTISTKDGSDICTYFLNAYGKIPNTVQMQYEVTNLAEYAYLFDQINEETMEAMKQQAVDAYTALAASWNKCITLTSMEYEGAYFLSRKGLDDTSYKIEADNYMVLVYKVNANIKGEHYSHPYDEDITFYASIKYSDVSIIDSNSQVNLNTCSIVKNKFNKKVYYGKGKFDYESFYIEGYETLDDLFRKEVNAYLDEYTYEGVLINEMGALPN